MVKASGYFIAIPDTKNSISVDIERSSPWYQYKSSKIENPKPMLFKLSKHMPKNPKLSDYLFLSTPSVVSKKIHDVLVRLKIDDIQLIPARIKGKQTKKLPEYWYVHSYHQIKCVDRKKSDCKIDDIGMNEVNKIVLDNKALVKTPLKKRLVFKLKEDSTFELIHKSVVDKIMTVKPTGVKFVEVEKWNQDILFE